MQPAPQEDVIVLKKSLVVNIGVAVLFFVLGAVTSYFLFLPKAGQVAQPAAQQDGAAQAQPTDPPAKIANVGVGKLPPLGSPDAPIKIVEFSDFQCPYCKAWNDDTITPLKQKYGDKIVLYYRHYPLTQIHPEAMNGAVAAECANEQGKFWDMHDALFRTQSVISVDNSKSLAGTLGLDAQKFNDCMTKNPYQADIAADISDGDSYGVSGTPTFFVNGVRLVGAMPLASFTAVIDQELAGK
ncbi:MAG TPA: thioredoxin domain-containing protein [Candidatus Edwardsbacteria bacterium]|nr:thioredoxin domain-containing protein [Candidatus Edwardsbacteria bacterium]